MLGFAKNIGPDTGRFGDMTGLTVALCQFRPVKGRPEENLDRIEAAFRAAAAAPTPPDVLVFPETILTGYFLEGGVLEHARSAESVAAALGERHARAECPPLEVCLGFYEHHEGSLYNAAVWVALGGEDPGIRHVHRKVFLPTYGMFDEARFVAAGREVRAFDTRIGRVAMLVCEDAWHGITSALAALDGAHLVAVLAAGPARGLAPDPAHPGMPGSLARWERLARDIAAEHGIFLAVAQLVGFEGGKGMQGGSMLVSPEGEVVIRAPLFEDATVMATVELQEVQRVRATAPLLSDLADKLPHLVRELERVQGPRPPFVPPVRAVPRGAGAVVPPPSVDALAMDPELTRRWLVAFLRDDLSRRGGFSKAILGLSGGVDSAVVAYLAAEALGPEHVIAVRMPYRTSSPDSLAHARLVSEALGIEEHTVDISGAVDGYTAACGVAPTPARLGNVMARTRMITLFDLSAALGALPLGTGNKSERLLGYFTWHADDTPPVNPIGDLFKTQVWALARHLGVPEAIVTKPASADLVAGQTDEDDFGVSYAAADAILDLLLRGFREPEIVAAGFTPEQVRLVRARLDGTHWKRRPPSVAVLSHTAVGEYYLRPVDY